ncbi:MAG: right-handed parallel beta-helix repeat-containing protein [Planctomycetota bacterium]|nr:right-handed parallel beta-helix repeat-containing protein [Planctomycetota bacterium]
MHKQILAITLATLCLIHYHSEAATYTVINTNNLGIGSLRQAILSANANPGSDSIVFNITGAGVHSIVLLSPLPALTDTVFIEGSTQAGWVAGQPVIELVGNVAGFGVNGFEVATPSQIKHLLINGFDGHGIHISGTGGAFVVGCSIGLNSDGVSATNGNDGAGIFIDNVANNFIGGAGATLRNIVSGNAGAGILIQGSAATGNEIRGNYIGTDFTGMTAIPNGNTGVTLSGCNLNKVGLPMAGQGNVISGNSMANVVIVFATGPDNLVQNNLIGLNATGDAVVSGSFTPTGIRLASSVGATIGGSVPLTRNVVAGHLNEGIKVINNLWYLRIEGNYIGTDASGQVTLGGHSMAGILLTSAYCAFIGGDTPAMGNVISGNQGDGIRIDVTPAATRQPARAAGCGEIVSIHHNLIGIAADGVTALGNGGHGVSVLGAGIAVIGSEFFGGNTIAYNTGTGVLVCDDTLAHVAANAIFDNGGLGIDLTVDVACVGDGVTGNDVDDLDAGPNDLLNMPVLTSAVGDSVNTMTVTGSLNTTPGIFRDILVYGNDTCDPSGSGEGRFFLGSFSVIPDAGGNVAFSETFTTIRPFNSNWLLTATHNRGLVRTSEFTPCLPIDSTFCGSGNGSCYAAVGNSTPGCENGDCCNLVCDVDPYCCDNEWDSLCAIQALQICGNSGNEQSGDCFTPNPSPGCYDLACVAFVCEADPFCCDTEWDALCAQAALANCPVLCPGDIQFVTPGIVDVEDLLFLLAAWGETGPPRPRADLDPPPTGDNVVNVNDLLYLLAAWGPCP